MSGEKVLTPEPVCEVCWLKDHARWEPESIDSTGNILLKLKGVDVPEKVNTGSVEVCHYCGKITVSGIYEMKDPTVIFHSDSDEGTVELNKLEEDDN